MSAFATLTARMALNLVKLLPATEKPSDAVLLLERLLREARSGQLTGVAIVTFRQNGDYSCELGGTAKDCPTFTRGAVKSLDDELARLL